jgi:hypothetical protein
LSSLAAGAPGSARQCRTPGARPAERAALIHERQPQQCPRVTALLALSVGGSTLATVMSEQMSRKSGPPESIRFWLGVAFGPPRNLRFWLGVALCVVLVIGVLALMIAYIWASQSDLP